jgi:hypothetical protein
MILVSVAKTPKSSRIMAHQNCSHMICERSLPRVNFAHTAHGTPLD